MSNQLQEVKYPVDRNVPRFECYNAKTNELVMSFYTVLEASQHTGVLPECIYNNLSGISKKCRFKHGSLYFKYVPSDKPKLSKQDKIEKHLRDGKTITGLEALKMYGLYRLSHAILMLRKKGLTINTEMVTKKSSTYAKYSLIITQ